MNRFITFSRQYPSYHPKAGQPTYFIEKIWNSIAWDKGIPEQEFPIPYHIGIDMRSTDEKKHHTIRAGHRWKAGDWFSPRVWSGKPYRSKMIQFAPEIQVVKTWDIDIHGTDWYLDGRHEYTTGWDISKETIAGNDGLNLTDFYDWFTLSPHFKKKQVFNGQIICWSDKVNY